MLCLQLGLAWGPPATTRADCTARSCLKDWFPLLCRDSILLACLTLTLLCPYIAVTLLWQKLLPFDDWSCTSPASGMFRLVRYFWIYEPYAATLGTGWSSWSYYRYSFLTIYSGVIINLSACSTCPTTGVLLVIFSLGFLLADWLYFVWTCRKHISSFVRRLEPYVSFLSNVFTVPLVLQLSFTCFWCFWSAQGAYGILALMCGLCNVVFVNLVN